MQFKSQSVIKGMKPSKGVIEDTGRPYDSTKVYIETQFSSDAEGWGNPSIQYNWGTSDNYHDFMRKYGNDKEFLGEVTWENQTTGNNSKLVVVDVRPVQQSSAKN